MGFMTTCDTPDADGDGLRDECDGCPADSNKIEPGICGCGVDDSADSDDDGVPDCNDLCPGSDDGTAGALDDTDGDGVLNCNDRCPGSDDNASGAQDDTDGDGVLNCNDLCPGSDDAVFGDCTGTIPTVSVWGLMILALLLLAGGKVVFRDRLRRNRLP